MSFNERIKLTPFVMTFLTDSISMFVFVCISTYQVLFNRWCMQYKLCNWPILLFCTHAISFDVDNRLKQNYLYTISMIQDKNIWNRQRYRMLINFMICSKKEKNVLKNTINWGVSPWWQKKHYRQANKWHFLSIVLRHLHYKFNPIV